jgi:GNAT superfamily N-acetyltransferase
MNYEDYSPHWQAKVTALADRAFGKGYFPRPSEIAREPQTCFHVCVTPDQEIAGFVRGRLLPEGGLDDFIEHRLEEIPEDLAKADAAGALGVIRTIAVDPAYRGKGIGTTLLQIVHDSLVGLGADKLIVTFKRGPRDSRVEGIMAQLGFREWVRLETYWKARCDAGEFDCVHRTNGCECEAVFYQKAVF